MAAGTLAAAYQVGKFAFKKGRELAARIKRKKIDALRPALRDPNMQALKTKASAGARAAEVGGDYDTKRVDANTTAALKAAIQSGNMGAFSQISSAANQQKSTLRQAAQDRKDAATDREYDVAEKIQKRKMDLQREDQATKELRNEAEIGSSSQSSESTEPGAVDESGAAAKAGLAALAKKRIEEQKKKGKKAKFSEMLLKSLGGGGEATAD